MKINEAATWSDSKQEKLCDDAKKKFGSGFWCKPGHMWDNRAIFWTGEGASIKGQDAFQSYTHGSGPYNDFGIHKDLAAWAKKNKVFLEPYDGGTLLGYAE